jgi:hypothetical protein
MAFGFELVTGSDMTLDRDNMTVVRKARGKGTLPVAVGGDFFDYVSSAAMSWVISNYATYGTPLGVLYWNSIQLHENVYGVNYDLSITYSPQNRQSGTYQITVDAAVGTQKVTAGVFQACYAANADDKVESDGTFLIGPDEVEGIDVPVAEDKITISYRHPQGYLNAGYIRRIGQLRGYPNSDTFLGYDPGEVVYMGGQFTQSDAEASATYNFAISPNVTNLVVAGITISDKKGWDALVPYYRSEVDTNGGGKKNAVREIQCFNVIRPRAWKAYKSVFGWGG